MSTTTATASAASSANVIKLDITSDSVCPFCLVGYVRPPLLVRTHSLTSPCRYSRIQQAIRELRATPDFNATFRLRFHPFQLDPTLPYSPGENKLERYERRFGGKEKVRFRCRFLRSLRLTRADNSFCPLLTLLPSFLPRPSDSSVLSTP